ncbi:TetR/AcrR family transcriptional regulator [Clostridium sp.]|uniref:TetR/AcrR family transcriptional regulator n=1 Tax=Clostridium sp. TaxID=1506 RepID=UPI00321695AB
MNQKEKSRISKEKILNAAIAEFGTKIYENASLNNICNDNKISKGLIYHYFENKDELFLKCVEVCFDELVEYLSKEEFGQLDFQKYMQNYFDLRYRFLKENVYYSHIFFNAVLQPPVHLKEKIRNLRADFDALNINHYRMALSNVTLRDGITKEEATEYFFIFQEMFNGYFQDKTYESLDFNSIIEVHELKLSKILNIMIYGIAKEEL